MTRVLFDEHGLQAAAERESGTRLSGDRSLLAVLEGAGCSVRFGPITDLSAADVVVLTTRHLVPYTLDELLGLVAWVQAGGGLFCLSNHGLARPDRASHNATVFDGSVASCFGLSLEPSWNRVKPTALMRLRVQGPLAGQDGWPVVPGRSSTRVEWVTCNNCCGIHPSPVAEIAVPLEAVGLRAALVDAPTTPGLSWMSTVEGRMAGSGRVVLCADSGWLGNCGSTSPGPGLFQLEDHDQLALNVLSWLSPR